MTEAEEQELRSLPFIARSHQEHGGAAGLFRNCPLCNPRSEPLITANRLIVRDIRDQLKESAHNGQNVYLKPIIWGCLHYDHPIRIINARIRGREIHVQCLSTGHWLTMQEGEYVYSN